MEDIEARLRIIQAKLARNVEENGLFLPEWKAVVEINALLANCQSAHYDLAALLEIYNTANKTEHYNGTAWHDVALHLIGLAHRQGGQLRIQEDRSLMLT